VSGGAGAANGWDPAQYDRFRAERRQPFTDLLSLLAPVPGGRAIDLGCGTGELTVALHRHLQAAETVGIDRSAAMLAGAERPAGEAVTFRQRDIADFPDPGGGDGTYDVVAANASLHWVADHPAALARLAGALRERGQLAFQVPANHDHPSHALAREVASEAPFAAALAGAAVAEPQTLAPEAYAVVLHQLGFSSQLVRLQVYGHVLDASADVVEWVKGTLLTPYKERLDPETYGAFVARYSARLIETVGDQRPYFYPFKRILCWARLPLL
jgi:trans-aconitate 2-methyltransferase